MLESWKIEDCVWVIDVEDGWLVQGLSVSFRACSDMEKKGLCGNGSAPESLKLLVLVCNVTGFRSFQKSENNAYFFFLEK